MPDTVGEARTSSWVMYSYGPSNMANQKQDDQLEHTYSSYVMIWDVTLKTWQRRWMIGRWGERGSGISVLVARHDDDDEALFNLANRTRLLILPAVPEWSSPIDKAYSGHLFLIGRYQKKVSGVWHCCIWWWEFGSRAQESVEYSFLSITLRPIMTWSDSTC